MNHSYPTRRSAGLLVIRGGLYLDGSGAPRRRADVGIHDGVVVSVSETPLTTEDGVRVVEAEGRWVMPGFVDVHTHYDAEVLVAPSLRDRKSTRLNSSH